MSVNPTHNLERQEQLEVAFLEKVRGRCPDYVPLLIPLGDMYTRQGRFEEGLDVDRRLVALRPHDAIVWYNLACSLALTLSLDDGIEAIEKAIHLGYRDTEHFREDRDLDNLRSHPAFSRLMQALEE